ncbi:acetyl-CoA carboxylase biotin carboxyl carrier protein [Shimia gijangensis]|uniref:Biotin carboxyl carrier protein of acetyl-CoA carboxylase n=1 Tax=Shimia gijangensis TaxID=1470563 RepID=A0A1M6T8R5_9RHOB|nr:acetyl-CoA carboxylase biotin carboxyl carrier protein [Shimia gijangensis]SHK53128.1 acetyl-CoA carboxylase biotin carboxyl carrier protein [Shimia gijangensis]
MTLSFSEVADILKIVDSSNCDEVILEQSGVKLVIRRGAQGETASALKGSPVGQTAVPTPSPVASSTLKNQVTPEDAEPICAPMVGTFYSRPAPDEAPFVTRGTRVSAGAPICVIEVMKLFTTLEASKDGIIEEILVEDGQLVEFDQPLFLLKSQ